MRYIIAPYMQVGFQNKVLYLGFGSISKKVRNLTKQNILLSILENWKTPKTPKEIEDIVCSSFLSQRKEIKQLIQQVIENRFIIPNDFFDPLGVYSRPSLFYAFSGADPKLVQKKLKNSSVLIWGCGGIGNIVSVSLGTAGVGRLILMDFDSVEASNLTRQFMFTKEDIGQSKAEVLAKALSQRTRDTQVEIVKEQINEEVLEKYKDVSLIVLSADSSYCLPLINNFSIKNKIPYINISYVQDIAVWGPFVIPGKTGCFYCQSNIVTEENLSQEMAQKVRCINERPQAPSNSPVNMLAASLGLLDIFKYLGNFGEIQTLNKRIGVWTHSLKIQVQSCVKNQRCHSCGESVQNKP